MFSILDVPAYGNCLFEAVGRSVGIEASQLRKDACAFMENGSNTLHGEKITDWIAWNAEAPNETYIREMKRDGTWGGGIELAILATLLEKAIVVYEKSGKRIAEFLPDKKDNLGAIMILWVHKMHYMQIVYHPSSSSS